MEENASREIRLCVLIDADNISYHYLKPMMQEIARYGNPTVKRIYGDWTKPNLNGWKKLLLDYAISPVQQFSYTVGKNSTDSALIIDAMDLLYSGRADAFCIVSSDSDYTRLAVRLREAGMTVYGIGEQKTPNAFIAACDRFIYLEILEDEDSEEEGEDKASGDEHCEEKNASADKGGRGKNESSSRSRSEGKESRSSGKENKSGEKGEKNSERRKNARALEPIDKRLLNLITQSIHDMEDEDGWAYLGEVGQLITKKQPSFDSRNYGFAKLSSLIGSIDLYEMEYMEMRDSEGKQLFVRVRGTEEAGKRMERRF